MNLPGYNFLPAPLWLIDVLHIVTLTLHFLFMNFVFGGIVAVLFGQFANKWDHPTVKLMVRLFPSAMAGTVTFGVAPLLFVQLTYHRQVYAASIISGWWWIGIMAAVIFSYYFLYSASFGKNAGRKGLYLGLALIGMLYVSLVYSSVFAMAENTTLQKEIYAACQAGWGWNSDVGSWLFRWLHMVTGAVTVGGFLLGWFGHKHEDAYKVGKNFFLWGMAVAALFGFIYLFTFGDFMLPFMRSAGIWILTVGIVLAAGSLHFYFKKKFVPAALMVFVSMVCMVITRHMMRWLRLKDSYEPSSLPVHPQWGIFVIFLVFFLIAVGLVWYMLKVYMASPEEAKK